eukprot:scaffold127841_cov28-Tisochrysis_lutea.AAC.2
MAVPFVLSATREFRPLLGFSAIRTRSGRFHDHGSKMYEEACSLSAQGQTVARHMKSEPFFLHLKLCPRWCS